MLKNWKIIYNIQLITFITFIVLTFIYYWDKEAHQYFNKSIQTFDFQSVFSVIMTYFFIFFFVFALVYPILFIIQLISIRKEYGKFKRKNFILLSVLYFMSIISIFALIMVNNSQAIKAIN